MITVSQHKASGKYHSHRICIDDGYEAVSLTLEEWDKVKDAIESGRHGEGRHPNAFHILTRIK